MVCKGAEAARPTVFWMFLAEQKAEKYLHISNISASHQLLIFLYIESKCYSHYHGCLLLAALLSG